MAFKELFTPLKIGVLEIKNRFVVPPMGTNFANPDGTVSEKLIEYLKARARGGWGLITLEIVAVDPRGKAVPNQLGIWDDGFIEGLSKLTSELHRYGATVVLQLHHAGRQTNKAVSGSQPVAPSPLSCPVCREVPRELSPEEIYELVEKFGRAAHRGREANFDAVELHGAHGYLIAQFMSSFSNRRVDEFGGYLFNRLRFPREIIKSIRLQAGADFPVIFRFSADEKMPDGHRLEESKTVARLIEEAGADALHVSMGTYGALQYTVAPSDVPPGYMLSYAEEVKRAVQLPVIAVGRISDPFMAADTVRNKRADLVAWGRQSLTDPETPNKVAAGRLEEIAPCIACNQGCIGNLFDPEKQKATCLVNPFCGRENEMKIIRASTSKKIAVVGGGPAGLMASWIAALRGHDVILYHNEKSPGGQWRIGSLAPAKQDITKAISYYQYMAEKYGVELNLNVEADEELIMSRNPDVVIIATGAKPYKPPIKGIDSPRILMATDVLEGHFQPGDKVLIIGGGLVGCETADFLAQQGYEVTLAEMLEEIASDIQDFVRFFLLKRLREYGVTVEKGIKVEEILDTTVKGVRGEEEIFLGEFDSIILATGATSIRQLQETLKERVPELYTIGDAFSPRKAINAIEEGAWAALKV